MADQSYISIHNKLVKQFRRSATYICWVGVLAMFALLFFLFSLLRFNSYPGAEDNTNVGLGGTFNIPTFLVLIFINLLPQEVIITLLFLANGIFSGLFIYLGLNARKGKKWHLYSGIIIYFIDAIGLILVLIKPVMNAINTSDIFLSLVVHIIFLFILCYAFYKRARIVALKDRARKDIRFERVETNKKVVISYKKSERELDEGVSVLIDEIDNDKNASIEENKNTLDNQSK